MTSGYLVDSDKEMLTYAHTLSPRACGFTCRREPVITPLASNRLKR